MHRTPHRAVHTALESFADRRKPRKRFAAQRPADMAEALIIQAQQHGRRISGLFGLHDSLPQQGMSSGPGASATGGLDGSGHGRHASRTLAHTTQAIAATRMAMLKRKPVFVFPQFELASCNTLSMRDAMVVRHIPIAVRTSECMDVRSAMLCAAARA